MTSVFSFLRHSALRDKNRYSWEPRADIRSGVYGRPDKAGFLLLSFSLQTQAGELRERSVPAHQLHLPAGLWCYRQGLPHLRLTVVSVSLSCARFLKSFCHRVCHHMLLCCPFPLKSSSFFAPSSLILSISLVNTSFATPLCPAIYLYASVCVWITMRVCYLQALNSKFKRRCIVNACQVIVF